MAPVLEPVTEPVCLGEGPHWDHAEQALYFVSIFDYTVHKYVPTTKIHTKAKLGEYVTSMRTFVYTYRVAETKRNHEFST